MYLINRSKTLRNWILISMNFLNVHQLNAVWLSCIRRGCSDSLECTRQRSARFRSQHRQLRSPTEDASVSAVLGAPSALEALCSNALNKLTLTLLQMTSLWYVSVCGRQFHTAEDALNGARHIVAMQIAHDPVVRESVRQVFRERAKITSKPTKKGIKVLSALCSVVSSVILNVCLLVLRQFAKYFSIFVYVFFLLS